jgi:hypothetical protein
MFTHTSFLLSLAGFLYGIDELLTYHYLIAETFRSTDLSHERFWATTKG